MKRKKTFLVEVEYEEKHKDRKVQSDVLYEDSIEVVLNNYMEGFIQTDSIEKEYELTVTEVKKGDRG